MHALAQPLLEPALLPIAMPWCRVGNTTVVNGDENPVCSQTQSLQPQQTLPVQCQATGRYLTAYRKLKVGWT